METFFEILRRSAHALDLWRWLTLERAPAHKAMAGHADMAKVRWVARLFVFLWIGLAIATVIKWADAPDDDDWLYAGALAGFVISPFLMVALTGWWRDRILHRLSV